MRQGLDALLRRNVQRGVAEFCSPLLPTKRTSSHSEFAELLNIKSVQATLRALDAQRTPSNDCNSKSQFPRVQKQQPLWSELSSLTVPGILASWHLRIAHTVAKTASQLPSLEGPGPETEAANALEQASQA